jgi:mannose-6-phosphate isomerase-like protein (cupin superfamily)
VWRAGELTERVARSDDLYLEFLRSESLSAGVYRLPAGAKDPQTPHTEDEVYYVLSGRASISIEGVEHPVEAGSVIFVEAEAPHRFVDIEDDLEVLVLFAPPETET